MNRVTPRLRRLALYFETAVLCPITPNFKLKRKKGLRGVPSQSFYCVYSSDQTSSMIAISAASPRRGPSFVMRV